MRPPKTTRDSLSATSKYLTSNGAQQRSCSNFHLTVILSSPNFIGVGVSKPKRQMALERHLPQKSNPLMTDELPPYEVLVARRRLAQTEFTVGTEQDKSKSSRPEGSEMFNYVHLRAPLPRGIISGIFNPSPSSYYLMRRSSDGYISATGMFKVTFPYATDAEEKLERKYIRSFDSTSLDESAGNIWIPPQHALKLAVEYQILPWIKALLDNAPIDAMTSKVPTSKITLPPPYILPLNFTEPPQISDRPRRAASPTRSSSPRKTVGTRLKVSKLESKLEFKSKSTEFLVKPESLDEEEIKILSDHTSVLNDQDIPEAEVSGILTPPSLNTSDIVVESSDTHTRNEEELKTDNSDTLNFPSKDISDDVIQFSERHFSKEVKLASEIHAISNASSEDVTDDVADSESPISIKENLGPGAPDLNTPSPSITFDAAAVADSLEILAQGEVKLDIDLSEISDLPLEDPNGNVAEIETFAQTETEHMVEISNISTLPLSNISTFVSELPETPNQPEINQQKRCHEIFNTSLNASNEKDKLLGKSLNADTKIGKLETGPDVDINAPYTFISEQIQDSPSLIPSPSDTEAMINKARETVETAESEESSKLIPRKLKRKIEEIETEIQGSGEGAEDRPEAKRQKIELRELKKEKVKSRALLGITATLAIGAVVQYAFNAL